MIRTFCGVTSSIAAPVSRGLLLLFLLLPLWGCEKQSTLEQVQQGGQLHIVTRNAPTTYYLDRSGPTGFEYNLANLFAQELGVELKITHADSIPELFAHLASNQQHNNDKVHLGAAQLSITESRIHEFSYSPSYDQVQLQLVYNRSSKKPKSLEEVNGHILVMAGSSEAERLSELEQESKLNWSATTALESVDLLKQVNDGQLAYTVVDSNTLEMNFLYFPNVRIAFDLPPAEQLAWVFPNTSDRSLIEASEQFFQRIEQDGTLKKLREQFYGHLQQLNYVGAKTFVRQLNQRLPTYRALFEQVAAETALDWRFLAAVGYQESHWRPTATSPTGVRGMMMLTRATAKEMGIKNRLDPEQSIRGGAEYYLKIKARLPERITEPDRTWLALAAYNVGLGHLEDARIITERRGGNPDLWIDIKKSLPLLADHRWYTQTRYGYARGREPVIYVQNIRRYWSILRWLTHPPSEALVLETELTPRINDQPRLEPAG